MAAPAVGLIVNPIAGMGGPVALRGTDGAAAEAARRGAVPIARDRATRLAALLPKGCAVVTCPAPMGADAMAAAGRAAEVVAITLSEPTDASDTRAAARALVERGVALLLFVGGDGTARDVAEAIGHAVPVLGVPAGVKMNSAVFAQTPEAGAAIVRAFLEGHAEVEVGEVVEVDEDALRAGELAPAHLASLLVPRHPAVASSKAQAGGSVEGLVEAASDLATPGATLVVGPGTTTLAIKRALTGAGTLLGVDVIVIGPHGEATLAHADATASDLEGVPETALLVVTPVGGQGFVLGRGNQQVVPALLARLGWEQLVVMATPEKLDGIDALRIDTGDPTLDATAPGHLRVITGPGFERLVRVARANSGA